MNGHGPQATLHSADDGGSLREPGQRLSALTRNCVDAASHCASSSLLIIPKFQQKSNVGPDYLRPLSAFKLDSAVACADVS